jgi:hypothetical protein
MALILFHVTPSVDPNGRRADIHTDHLTILPYKNGKADKKI